MNVSYSSFTVAIFCVAIVFLMIVYASTDDLLYNQLICMVMNNNIYYIKIDSDILITFKIADYNQ